jgi:ribosome-binding protein aMBF1 (putative translation factor)
MEHQDWNSIKLNTQAVKNKDTIKKPHISTNKVAKVEKMIMKEPLGKIIAQARVINGKNQKELASMIGISQQILSRWEANKDLPNNSQIALLEKTLKVKLPRCQKVYVDENN